MDISEIGPIQSDEMQVLATEEYRRIIELLRSLETSDWERPTPCGEWSIREIVAHLLGTAEANASIKQNLIQMFRGRGRAKARGSHLVDGINEVQVHDRRHLTPQELMDRLERVYKKAVRGRYKTPRLIRRISMADPTGGKMTMGHLVDIVYTRDEWMHRIDICTATGRVAEMDPAHDGRIVADVVREWARKHSDPIDLVLTGDAGGHFTRDVGGAEQMTADAVEFCLALSGRYESSLSLAHAVVF